MTKIASLFFDKMFQTKSKVSENEKIVVVGLMLSIGIMILGYFTIS